MTDEEKKAQEAKALLEGNKDSDNGDKDAPPTPEELKAATDENAKLQHRLGAQENQSSADRRKLEDRIKTLESEKRPPEDNERIATLEVELARSKAVSQHGLSVEDAALLKGTPEEILADAEYWAKRVKDKESDKTDPDKTDETNRDIIDKKVDGDKVLTDAEKAAQAKKPTPKAGEQGTWLERYKAADPRVRSQMDADVQKGIVDPTK